MTLAFTIAKYDRYITATLHLELRDPYVRHKMHAIVRTTDRKEFMRDYYFLPERYGTINIYFYMYSVSPIHCLLHS